MVNVTPLVPPTLPPDSGKIGAIGVRESMKTDTVISIQMPHKIVADGLLDTSRDVQYNLLPKKVPEADDPEDEKEASRDSKPSTRFGL